MADETLMWREHVFYNSRFDNFLVISINSIEAALALAQRQTFVIYLGEL